jgi:hypothetical protein
LVQALAQPQVAQREPLQERQQAPLLARPAVLWEWRLA